MVAAEKGLAILFSVPPRPRRLLSAFAALLLCHFRGPGLAALETATAAKFHGQWVFPFAGCRGPLGLTGGLVHDPFGELGQVQALWLA